MHDQPARNMTDASPAAGDESGISAEEFSELYTASYGWLLLVASASANRTDAEDIVQQASLAAMRDRSGFMPGTNFRGWMAAYVRHAAANHRRSERRMQLRHAAVARGRASDGVTEVSTPSDDPTLDHAVQQAIDDLDDRARTCFLLRTAYGLGYAEIARVIDVPEATCRSHVYRARRTLLAQLEGNEGGNA